MHSATDDQGDFTGHIRDSASGLTPYIFPPENCTVQARYYDPIAGRFLSVDPVTFLDTGEPGYFNRYAYVMNDPINGFDPNGMWKVTIGASAKVSYGPGGRVGASISYDTNGHTLSVKGLAGPRVGAGGALSITGDISESDGFAKSDVKLGLALDGEASVGFAKATAEVSGEASLRDGFSGDSDADVALGAEAIVEGGSIAGGTLEGSLGLDAGLTGSAEIAISGAEIVNAVKSGANFAAEQVGKIERGLNERNRGL